MWQIKEISVIEDPVEYVENLLLGMKIKEDMINYVDQNPVMINMSN